MMLIGKIARTLAPALLTLAVLVALTLGFVSLSGSLVGSGYLAAAEHTNARQHPAGHANPAAGVDRRNPGLAQIAGRGAFQ